MWFWGTKRRSDERVQPGQKYRTAARSRFGQPLSLMWEVERVYVGPDGMHHARLLRLPEHNNPKVVSVDALLDPELYEPI